MKKNSVFRVVRKRLKLTRYKMAKTLGITQGQYDYLESMSSKLNPKYLKQLFRVSGMTAREYMSVIYALYVK